MAEKFEVGKTQINDIMKNKDELEKVFDDGDAPTEIVEELCNNDNEHNFDVDECENPKPALCEKYAKLKDTQKYFWCNNNDELVIDIFQIFNSKLKDLK